MIALLGGTFDPVHLGHLRVAWEASEALHCPVHMLPARTPPHREPPVASAAQRCELLRAALAGQQRLLLDTRELQRDQPSWTVDTLQALRAEQGEHEPLVLLLGSDTFAGLPQWHRWQEVLRLAHIGVLTRPGYAGTVPEAVARAFPECLVNHVAALRAAAHGRVLPIAVTALDISATRIRALLAAGSEPRYLLPEAVLQQAELLDPYRPRRA